MVAEKVVLVGVVASSTAGVCGCVGGGWDPRCGVVARASFWTGDDVRISSLLGRSERLAAVVLTERNPDMSGLPMMAGRGRDWWPSKMASQSEEG